MITTSGVVGNGLGVGSIYLRIGTIVGQRLDHGDYLGSVIEVTIYRPRFGPSHFKSSLAVMQSSKSELPKLPTLAAQ